MQSITCNLKPNPLIPKYKFSFPVHKYFILQGGVGKIFEEPTQRITTLIVLTSWIENIASYNRRNFMIIIGASGLGKIWQTKIYQKKVPWQGSHIVALVVYIKI